MVSEMTDIEKRLDMLEADMRTCFDNFGHDVVNFGDEENARYALSRKYVKYMRQEMTKLITSQKAIWEEDLLFDLDEIDNKPWRVFRQLAKIMPGYADTYLRYEAFYTCGGGQKVMELIEAFEKTDEFKQSGFPERIAQLSTEDVK